MPVSGDWDGDGRWDVGVYDHRTSVFFLRNALGNMSSWYVAGSGLPITGDWDGDGRWDLGHYNPATRTFTLRSGVKFHDGSDLDANDVARTYRAQWDAEDPAHTGRVGDFTYFSALFGGFLNPPPASS